MRRRISWMIGLAALSAIVFGQSWMTAYDDALAKSRAGDWKAAREAFKSAAAYRAEDQSRPTTLPGPATERRVWRNGAPYSPNFLTAYAGFKAGMGAAGDERTNLLKASAAELEALLTKGQTSAEAFFFLNQIYTTLGDTASRMKLDTKMAQSSGQMTWKVDTEIVSPEENAAVAQMSRGDIDNPATATPDPGTMPNPNVGTPTLPSATGARVPTLPTKFALIIGNSESKLANYGINYGADDAQLIRESLLANAGYAEQNVDIVLNGTAAAIKAAATALGERVPDGGTVFIFFAGVGMNLGGKDYLAGVDTESVTDASSMLSKSDLFQPFMAKGARIFAFFESNRNMVNGRYFGMEVPLVGAIAQSQATIPGERVQEFTRNGKQRGIYADALAGALAEVRANRIPIQEFGWVVFNRIRKGDSGTQGGGSRQTPTLPVLTNLASDARF